MCLLHMQMFSLQPLLVVWTRWLCTLELVRLEQARGSRVEITIPRSKVASILGQDWYSDIHPFVRSLRIGIFPKFSCPPRQSHLLTVRLSQTCFLIDIKFRRLTGRELTLLSFALWFGWEVEAGINDFCGKHNSLCIKQWEQTCKHNENENKNSKVSYQI